MEQPDDALFELDFDFANFFLALVINKKIVEHRISFAMIYGGQKTYTLNKRYHKFIKTYLIKKKKRKKINQLVACNVWPFSLKGTEVPDDRGDVHRKEIEEGGRERKREREVERESEKNVKKQVTLRGTIDE